MELVIIDYGAGNVQSVKYALNRLGIDATLSNDPATIKSADKIIFPGVGAAGPAMEALKENGIDELIPTLTQPVLGICLGMQLMCTHSEEGNVMGLGIIDVNVQKFIGEAKIPHMGWNNVSKLKSSLFEGFSTEDQLYFVHSYYVPVNEFTIAECDYIQNFSAAIQKDNFYACQFHPEKSGDVGEQLLKKFIALP
ncbi:MAG: glutamine amidotransferase [Saprospiraceae bacterium]|jgi:glutamine amidotransferase